MRAKILSLLITLFCAFGLKAQEAPQTPDSIMFSMYVYNSSNKMPLRDVKVSVSGLSGKFSVDSLEWIDRKTDLMNEAKRGAERGWTMQLPDDINDPMKNHVRYSGMIPYDSVLIVSLNKEGFEGRTMRFKTTDAKVYDRTAYYHAGNYGIYPGEKSLRLNEVTVTATKVKMFYNGDTLVYNADAFNLPDGSMLDALIRALPGATLSRGGHITINGEPVRELLVNGKKFFNGDPIVALENLPHYTIKDVKVYKKAPDEIAYSRKVEERDKTKDPLVLDVNLKREFMKGLITNYTLGGGVNVNNDPTLKWLGRIFALVYDSNMEYGLYIQGNNVNSDASVDGSGRWSSSNINAGLVTSAKAGANFKITWKDQKREGFNSNLTVRGRENHSRSESEMTEFFTEGTRWSTSEGHGYSRALNMSWNNVLTRHFRSGLFKTEMILATQRDKRDGERTLRQSALNAQDSAPDDPLTADIQSYQSTRNIDNSRRFEGIGRVSYAIDPHLIPGIAQMKFSADYNAETDRSDYNSTQQIIYPAGGTDNYHQTAEGLQKRTNNSVDLSVNIGSAKYVHKKFSLEGGIDYRFLVHDNRGDLNRYYENLSGSEPALLTPSSALLFDEINSYDSHYNENINKFSANLNLRYWNLKVNLGSTYELNYRKYQENRVHSRIDLHRYSKLWTPSVKIDVIGFSYRFDTYLNLPNMSWLNDAEDTTDPMNIYRGNPRLKDTRSWNHSLSYGKRFGKRHHYISASISYRKVDNAISRAHFLNPETGVTITTPMNVNGNRSTSESLSYGQNFGPNNRFSFQNSFSHSLRHTVDYSSELDNPGTLSSDYRTFSDKFTLSLSIRDFVIRGNIDMRFNRQHSEKYRFTNSRYADIDYSFEAQGTLPWNIGLETSLTLNSRYGYGNSKIDRPYWVWDLSLSKKVAPKWLVKIYGYDILQQIPTFSRYISTTSMSMSRYNAQPSYVLLSVTYSLTVTPKKR
ncbi:MAG: outer membrane beta-barrel family protein [Muribaculaceae bacterium]|nr:outer membrane beta-barrel family protein [Muribaculaceae bacterium]